MMHQGTKCKLLPYRRKDILSAQELKEKLGWGVQQFNIPELWKHSKGEGTKVAVLDTGIDLNHDDLKNNILPGINFVKRSKPPMDDSGHGSHVSSVISAEAGNNIGIAGVAPKCKILPVKVLDEYGDGELEDVAAGVRWAIDQNVDAICMSLGSARPLASLRKAIQKATQKGIPVFVAAGNLGRSEHLLFPANYPETIAISAIDKNLDLADFSMTGNNLDFVAPGVDILGCVPDNWYAIMSGSSQATPFVVGLAMLLLSYVKKNEIDIPLNTVDDYRNVFKRYTSDIVSEEYAGNKFYQGFGIITPKKWLDNLNGYSNNA